MTIYGILYIPYMSNDPWLEKYRPISLNDVLGDKCEFMKLQNFLKQFNQINETTNDILNPNIIITGNNGIGKTLIVDLILKDAGFKKIVPDLNNISITRKTKKKNITEKEPNNCSRTIKTYYKTLTGNKTLLTHAFNKKSAIVFDDVSNISNSKEKEAIKTFVKTNNKIKKIPIIVIANTKHSKTVNEIRKMVTYNEKNIIIDGKKINRKIINEITLRAPNYTQIYTFIKKICFAENMKIIHDKNDEDDIYVELVNHAQYDIRRLINILEELHSMYPSINITLDKFKKFCETSKTKDVDPGIYEATRLLLNQYTNIDQALQLYGEERATIPLMVHENYPLNIMKQYSNLDITNKIDMMYNISKSISESDKIDGIIYSNQCWNLQPVHGFYACVLPSYYINSNKGKKLNAERYRFAQDYNKTSIKKINNKVIKNAQENPHLKKVSVYDFLYISSILKTLFEKKDFQKVVELMKPYGLTVKQIESIIKIDKIKKIKNTLTGKQKSILKEMLGVSE